MIVGGDKQAVIDNIQRNFALGEMNRKVEINDPKITDRDARLSLVERHLAYTRTWRYTAKNWAARTIVHALADLLNWRTKYVGLEKVRSIHSGAIVTSNHFSPLENMTVTAAMRHSGHRRTYIISQDTNFAMPGFLGFFLKYYDTIPITKSHVYLSRQFPAIIDQLLSRGRFVLIYPEEEMWFNYRRPRPEKHGAFDFAARAGVPIVPCFVEMRDKKSADNEQFMKTRTIIHILDPIYPDPELSVQENSSFMRAQDYREKVEAYEQIYGKSVDAPLSAEDIAGWREPLKTAEQLGLDAELDSAFDLETRSSAVEELARKEEKKAARQARWKRFTSRRSSNSQDAPDYQSAESSAELSSTEETDSSEHPDLSE